ncbi:MAG: tRNA 2-thiouridine(34) synthase MnmA, partial [Gammaproteobacteria bacterium]|nr:tRNA 2-thiouridine(34) synthase MnmA [Gammaproteobacteria bacterium]
PIRDNDGVTLGEHIGLPYYTIGQRQGLGIGGIRGQPEAPWYVKAKDNDNNTLVVTQAEQDLQQNWLSASQLNWLVDDVSFPLTCQAKIRYRQADQACRINRRADGLLLARFAQPQRAVTPGQYVCFYDGDICLGGGVIEQAGNT